MPLLKFHTFYFTTVLVLSKNKNLYLLNLYNNDKLVELFGMKCSQRSVRYFTNCAHYRFNNLEFY